MKDESKFKSKLIEELERRFPGCFITKNDESICQGIPDLLVLYNDKWAMLETKSGQKAKHRPNQDLYVAEFNKMSFAAFIFPENMKEVLDDLERAFKGT